MLTFIDVWRWGIFWGILVNNITARKVSGNGVHPRNLNISALSPPSASSSLDPASFSSLDQASALLPQAPADYCGLCIIEAPGGIRLVYWEPDDVGIQANVTANPTQPYTTVDNGFTYTSPSVYVIYSELQATVSATGTCDSSASGDPVGPSYAAKTIGYSSRFLAYGTVTFPGPNCDEQYIEDGFHTIDFSELYYTPIVTSTVYKSGCAPYANPRLSLPADLTDVVPAWKTCQPLFYGAFDPPSVLSKATGLAPAQAGPAAITPVPPPIPALPAAAQATPAAETPAATTAPNNDGQKAVANGSPASVNDSNDGILLNGNTHKIVATPAASPQGIDPGSQKNAPAVIDPSDQLAPAAPVVVNSPAQNPPSDPNSEKVATDNNDPSGQAIGPAAPVIVNSPIQTPASAVNVVVAHGKTLTENGPSADIGGKAALYSSGSVYFDSTPVAVPTSAQVAPANVAIAQGQTLTENGPSAVIDGKPALYKAGSIYYDSIPVAVATSAQGQQAPAPVVAAGVTFAPTIQTPSPVVTNAITFAPAVEKASAVVAGGITITPISQPVGEDSREPVIAGGITFQPSHLQSPNAVALETPAPLSVGGNPVIKAANGGLLVAGTTISPGITASLLGHIIAANSDNVVLDGTTHSLAPVTPYPVETPTWTPLDIANQPVLIAANGDLVVAGSTIPQGSTTSLLGHAISVGSDNVVLDGTTHAFGPVTAHPLETPTPLEIANQPVFKDANGGLVIAGTTIPQGSQTSLLGHIISVGANNVVEDGKTLSFAANTEAAGQQSATSLVYGTSNIITTLTPGATYASSGQILTYTGATPSVLTEPTSSVIGTTTVPIHASALPSQVFVEASTPEQLFVEASSSPSAEEYVLNGKTHTAATPSDVPIGGLILASLNGSAPINISSVLPSIILANGTMTSIPTSSSPSSSTSAPAGSKVTPSSPTHGIGSRVIPGRYFVPFGYVLGVALVLL